MILIEYIFLHNLFLITRYTLCIVFRQISWLDVFVTVVFCTNIIGTKQKARQLFVLLSNSLFIFELIVLFFFIKQCLLFTINISFVFSNFNLFSSLTNFHWHFSVLVWAERYFHSHTKNGCLSHMTFDLLTAILS